MRAAVLLCLLVFFAAGCGPRWTLDDRTTAESVTIDAGSTHARAFAVESSHPIAAIRIVAEDISAANGVIRVAHDDSREGCSLRRDYQGRDGKWSSADDSSTRLDDGRFELTPPCDQAYRVAQVRVSLTNGGTAPLTLRWFVVAVANGDGSDSPPNDAFVRVKIVE